MKHSKQIRAMVLSAMFLALGHKASVRKSNLDATGKDPECFREVVLNSWIARGMEVALIALLVTARRLRMKGA